ATPTAPVTTERIPLAQLPPASPMVNLRVRVLTINTKEVNARGEAKQILWGLLGDESGTAPYTSWRPLEGLEKGDILDVEGAYTKEYNGSAQVNFGDRTRITKRTDVELPTPKAAVTQVAVGDLKEGQRGVRVTGRILAVAPRQVTVQGQPRTVWGGTFADATGKVEFTSWHDHRIEAGQAVTIEGGYVRAFRNVPQLTFDQDATVTPAEGVPEAAELERSGSTPIWRLLERGGGSDLSLVATMLEVRPGSGLVLRCGSRTDGGAPCGRVLASGQCRIHGKAEGTPDLRVKGVLDDGTGAVSVVIGREATERLLGKDLAKCVQEARDSFRPEVIQDQLKEALTGRVYRVRGNAMSDEYGVMVIARSVEPAAIDTEAGARVLLAELEGI
ncbi:MAG TPA: hypothetical protein VFH47_06030, partial [Candidatus Thermoplasmatota archaeon]|nr:hypothetical protein [Candidatus Thermoplasmatota archaeon]